MARSGGGITSKNKREVGMRLGNGNRGVSKEAVSQIGIKQGSHVSDGPGRASDTGYRGAGKILQGNALNPSTFGNALATNVGKGGPGAGRKLYGKSGTQCQTGPANPGSPRPQGPDIWSEYPPSKKAQI